VRFVIARSKKLVQKSSRHQARAKKHQAAFGPEVYHSPARSAQALV
jgi:hypothetical protein